MNLFNFKIILMFHKIVDNPNSKYDVSWRKFKFILLFYNIFFNILFHQKISHKILFTFDDGYISQLAAARYLARYYKVFSIIFITTDLIDCEGYINKKQIKQNISKYIKFGSHGKTHKSLDKSMLINELFYELKSSKKYLEDLTGQVLFFLSFPNGLFNKNSLKAAYDLGYKYIFTSKRSSNRRREKNSTFNRFVILKDTPFILVFLAYTGILDFSQNFKKQIRNFKFKNLLIKKHNS